MTDLSAPSLANLLPALVAAQTAFGPARKDASNAHFGSTYLTLAAALAAILPALNANGLAVVQATHLGEGGVVILRTVIWHTSGEWIASEYPVLPSKPDPQGYGSALTYARRYAVMALAGIAPEDDDGNAASTPPARAPAAKHRAKFPDRSERAGAARATRPAADQQADALAADLADAIDDAASSARLDELVPSLQTLPASLRGPLRRRFSDRRARLREIEQDQADLDHVGQPQIEHSP